MQFFRCRASEFMKNIKDIIYQLLMVSLYSKSHVEISEYLLLHTILGRIHVYPDNICVPRWRNLFSALYQSSGGYEEASSEMQKRGDKGSSKPELTQPDTCDNLDHLQQPGQSDQALNPVELSATAASVALQARIE